MYGRPRWFHDLFGFEEGDEASWNETRGRFQMDGHTLCCPSAPSHAQRQHVGDFELPLLSELRQRLAASANASTRTRSLRFDHLAAPSGVGPMILDPGNAGAVFQVASQFNCLEMISPAVSPTEGVAIYACDRTQGPACALACPAGTVFRNYLYKGVGQHPVQIDTLADVGAVLHNTNPDARYWVVRNGYCLPTTESSMADLARVLRFAQSNDPALIRAAEGALRVGVHSDTQAKPPCTHRVAQVFASALPVAYASTPTADWEPFARLVLRAAYEATLAVAACRSVAGSRVTVYLTALGGGAFGNETSWILDAIREALDTFDDWPLDVFLVHYGQAYDRYWAQELPARKGHAHV